MARCEECGGTGLVGRADCDECGGCGEVPERCCHCDRVLLTRREVLHRTCYECSDAQAEDAGDDIERAQYILGDD